MIWIDIKDCQPPKKTSVLVTDGKEIGITEISMMKGLVFAQFGYTKLKGAPTHWMPLPLPPEIEK